jgi:hypothetical protein
MHKITTNHGSDLAGAAYDGDGFQKSIPLVVHCESEKEAQSIAAYVHEAYGEQ